MAFKPTKPTASTAPEPKDDLNVLRNEALQSTGEMWEQNSVERAKYSAQKDEVFRTMIRNDLSFIENDQYTATIKQRTRRSFDLKRFEADAANDPTKQKLLEQVAPYIRETHSQSLIIGRTEAYRAWIKAHRAAVTHADLVGNA